MTPNYLVHRDSERDEILHAMGLESIDDLFSHIPEHIRLNRPLDLPPAYSEWALEQHIRQLASANRTTRSHLSYIGGGMYEHHIPAVVDALANRGEFLTAYTPYQPEMSQGLLQSLAEYQQAIAALTGVPVVNSSSYDGATAMCEGVWVACLATVGERIVVSSAIWPQYRQTLETYLTARNVEIEYVDPDPVTGRLVVADLQARFADNPPNAFVFQSPNALGVLEDVKSLGMLCFANRIVSVMGFNPIQSGIFHPPGKYAIDVVFGDGQPLGIPLSAGGATLGLLACRKEYRKYMPGRLVGLVENIDGNPAYALTHEEREQHVARERATSNICSNQAWCALRAVIYLAALGEGGIRRLARLNARKAHYLADQLAQVPGVSLTFSGPFFNEFMVTLPKPVSDVQDALLNEGIFGGIDGRDLGRDDALLMAVTETKSKADLDHTAEVLAKVLA